MIKKIVKVILVALLIVPSICGMVAGGAMGVEAAGTKATVRIHKKKMTTLPNPLIQNTGGIINELEAYEGLEGVEFSVHNISHAYYTLLKGGIPQEQTLTILQAGDIPASATEEANGITGIGGILDFSLPKKSTITLADEKSKEVDSVYLFVETSKAGITKADNMILAFPVYKMVFNEKDKKFEYSDDELDLIHLYPKNTLKNDGSVEVIKKVTADNAGLNGAEFRLQKQVKNETGDFETWVVTGVADGLYKWEKLGATGVTPYTFISGNSYSIGGTEITENPYTLDADKGKLTINNLDYGTYKLVETKAPENSEMINEFFETEFTITDNKTVKPRDIMNDTIIVDKTITDSDHNIGEEIDYSINFKIPMGIQDKVTVNNEEVYRYHTVTLTDTHSPFLTFVNDADKFSLTNDDVAIPQNEYTVEPAANGLGFVVTLSNEAIRRLTPEKQLKFNYKMFLNKGATPDNGFENKAEVVVKGETDELKGDDKEKVYTGGKRFEKIDGDNGRPIQGAEFVVRNGTGSDAKYLRIDETTKKVTWVDTLKDPADDNKDLATVFTSDDKAIFEVTGLEYGDYYLQEIKAPDKYIELTDLIEFTIEENSYSTDKDVMKVPNKHKGTLPSTGGMGIVALLGFGVAAFGIAGVYFKRNGKAEV